MQNIKLSGLVIRVIHYQETSEIVHLLTQNGTISIMCKGARKLKSRKLSFCIPLTLVDCIITDSTTPNLVDYTIVNNLDYIKEDLVKNLWFNFFLEILNNIPPNTYYKNIYNLILRLLDLAKFYNPILLVTIGLIKLLKIYGVEPNFKSCVVCNSQNIQFFSISCGGCQCINHTSTDSENLANYDIIKELYYLDIYNNNLDKYINLDYKKIFDMVKKYYEYHVDINLRHSNSLIFK